MLHRLCGLLVLLGIIIVSAHTDKLSAALSLPKDEYVALEVMRDLSAEHVILFQSPESVPVEVENPLVTPTHSDRTRTKTKSNVAADPLYQDRANQDSWIRLVREKDPNNDLHNKFGFNYLGRVSLILPDFHVIISNKESSAVKEHEEELYDYLKKVFGATWISSTQTTKQLRKLRRASDIAAENDVDEEDNVSDRRAQIEDTTDSRTRRREAREARKSSKFYTRSKARRKTLVGQFMDEDKKERRNRRQKRKLLAREDSEDAQLVGQNVKQSALRRLALKTIHPDGPIGRSLTAPWTSRRLQGLEEDLRYSYERSQFPSDPMVKDQWYIHGGYYENKMRRQRVVPLPAAAFLDVIPLWKSPRRIDGRGIVVAIVDDGVNFVHSDLKDKIVPMLSVDLAEPVWVSPDEPNREEIIDEIRRQTRHGLPRVGQNHGTSMASITAGSPSDGTCGTGVAPGAMVSSVRVIGLNEMDGSGVGTTGNMLSPIQESLALSHRCVNADPSFPKGSRRLENMVYVVGWGPVPIVNQAPTPVPWLVKSAIQGCIQYGRSGLGSVYIFPSGNAKQLGDSVDFDGYASMRQVISVGSVSPTGYPLPYSEGGESLMLVTPSGYTKGRGITAATTKGAFHDSRMQTLDAFSEIPHGARSVKDSLAAEEGSARTSLSATGCTSKFTGTSASASMIGGVVSMMLQANPSLTWKDVQDILIRSCVALHYGETLHYSGESHDRMYRDVLPMKLAQERNDNIYSHFQPAVGSGTKPKEHDEGMNENELKGLEILNHIKTSLYIFYQSTDPVEWIANRETGLHHSRLMGFGIPDVNAAIEMSQKRGRENGSPSIQNDYSLTSTNLVDTNAVHYAFGARDSMGEPAKTKEDTFMQGAKEGIYYQQEARGGIIRPQETAAWHVQFDPEKDRVHQIYDDSLRATRNEMNVRQSENFVMERVELRINATVPMGISNMQLALCDRSALCSLFIPGLPYEKSKVEPQQLEYTFSSIRYWGQHNPYDGAWVILLRNRYPTRSSAVEIDHLSITVYGHYV